MVIGFKVIWVVVGGVTGDAGVWWRGCLVGYGVADGTASQGDRGDGAGVAGRTCVVVLGIVGVNQRHGEVAVLDTGGVAACDEHAVVGDMVDIPVGMAVDTGEGDSVVCSCLGDSVGDGGIGRIDVNVSGGIMAGAATGGDVPVFDVIPGFDLPQMATGTAAALTCRDVAGRIVLQPMGNGGGRAVFVGVEVVSMALVALA